MKRLNTQQPKVHRSLRAQHRWVAQRGAAGVEYGIMVASIAAAIVGVALLLGPKLTPGFQAVINALP